MTATRTYIRPQAELLREPQLADVPVAQRASVRRAIEIAVNAVYQDRPFTIPQSQEERANGFTAWIAQKRQRLEPKMRAALAEAFADVAPLDETTAQKYLECCVWPEVEFWLQDFAIRYHAGIWKQKHYGDGTYMMPIERFGDYWRIPIGVNGYGRNLGQIIVDNEGNVIEKLTTTRQEILEQLHGRTFSESETIAWK